MSVFQFIGSDPSPIYKRITSSTVTTIIDATDNIIFVPWLQINETNGGTQNLTVDIYDGSNAVYLASDGGLTWNAKAVTAKTAYFFTQGLVIPKTYKLRVTSSDASGFFHIHGVMMDLKT